MQPPSSPGYQGNKSLKQDIYSKVKDEARNFKCNTLVCVRTYIDWLWLNSHINEKREKAMRHKRDKMQ